MSHDVMPPMQDEEVALWAALTRSADHDARNRLFMRYQWLARRIATRLFRQREMGDLDFSDVLQLASTGLLEAIGHYRPETGVPFRYYGNRRIAGAVLDGLAHMSEYREQVHACHRLRHERLSSIKSPRLVVTPSADLQTALDELGAIATELALGFMLEDSGLVNNSEADQQLSPYESLAWRGITAHLTQELEKLPERDRLIISYHYLGGIPFETIARMLGLTKGRISQIHKAVIGTLRKRLLGSGLSTSKG